MARPLDFIVFGVPRSGTKALVHALNLHPHVYCAMERFHFRADHSRISFPDSFLATRGISNKDDLAKIECIGKDLTKKGDVRYAGNKLPRYYFALHRINQEVPTLKNIWIYRSPYGFMQSWNRRELDSQRGQWPAGQVGLFGLLELLCCIEACLNLDKDVLVFPYDYGLNRSARPMLRALDFLGADPGLYARHRFKKKQLPKGQDGSHRLPLKDYEEEILGALKVKELDAILHQERSVRVSEVAAPLGDYLRRIAAVLPRAVDRAFAACDNRAVPSYGWDYVRRNRAELGSLLKLADGSKTLADFQRFGAYQRLKSLYVQRWALRRRLAAIWLSGSA
jgi:Sulfotransferase family